MRQEKIHQEEEVMGVGTGGRIDLDKELGTHKGGGSDMDYRKNGRNSEQEENALESSEYGIQAGGEYLE